MNVQDTMRRIVEAESDAIRNIPYSPEFDKAVELIMEHVVRRGGKLVTSGMGKAGQIAMNIATTFASTGIPSVNLHPSEAQHGDLGVLQPNDVMLLISNSGKTREILELVQLARNLIPDIPLITITGHVDTPLAECSDAALFTGGAPEVCPLGLTPTTSTTLMTVIGDILVVNVMERSGFTAHDYALRHHGGYLGPAARSKSVCDK